MKICLIVTTVLIAFHIGRTKENRRVWEHRILDSLLDPKVYDSRIRPDGDTGKDSPIVVKVSMYVIDVPQKDPYSRDFSILCHLRQRWEGNRMPYQKEGRTIREIHFAELQKIHKADLLIYNKMKGNVHDFIVPNVLLHVNEERKVFVGTKLSVMLKCVTDLAYFPHDQQKCRINIRSYGYYSSKVLLKWDKSTSEDDFDKNISKDKYFSLDLKSMKSENETNDSTLHVDLLFSRNFNPYLRSLYLPYVVLVIISWGSFCLRPDWFFMRFSLLVVVLLAMLHFSPNFTKLRHKIPNPTALDFWVFGCIGFVAAAMIEFVLVYQLSSNDDDDEESSYADDDHSHLEEENKIVEKSADCNRNGKVRALGEGYSKKNTTRSSQIDAVSLQVVFPMLFLMFNIIYWFACCARKYSTLGTWYGTQP